MRLGRKLIYPAYAYNPQSTGELNELHKTLTIVSIRKLKKKKSQNTKCELTKN